jgi:molecular chaperone DnaK (HSP70)
MDSRRDPPGAIGIDFGTTNTVLSAIGRQGEARLVAFEFDGQTISPFRSTLSFHEGSDAAKPRVVEAGPWAVEAYLEEPLETRLIQSFKSYAASPLFKETRILGRRFAFEDLLSAFMLRLRSHAGLTQTPTTAIVGRPVNFAGSSADPALAVRRYQRAFERLGFTDIRYAYEPVAAAFFFARRLTEDATVMVGDFGGGTSDFSIVRFHREADEIRSTPLANSGVGFSLARQGIELQGVRQHPAGAQPLLFGLRAVGAAGIAQSLTRHGRYPGLEAHRLATGEDRAARGDPRGQPRLSAVPGSFAAEGDFVERR